MNCKLFTLVILSLASVALAGPAGVSNKIDTTKDITETLKTPAAETLKQWCVSSQMSQPELTQSFKKLVAELKQTQSEQLTDAVVINAHLCQAVQDADMNASELVKDVYMDALSACDKRECMKQLVKCIDSGKVDKVRANYYMTRLAVNDNKSALEQKDMIAELSESFVQSEGQQQSLVSMAIQRQKMFAVTANLAKQMMKEMEREQNWEQVSSELKQITERVVRAINKRFIQSVTQQEVEEYKQKSKTPAHLAEKIAERNAALKALANIPGHVLAHFQDVEQVLIQLAQNKQELSTTRQSAIEALEQNEKVEQIMTEIALQHQQEEPIEVRVAAYRCLMTTVFAGAQDESVKQQKAHEIVTKVLKYVESQQNQQQNLQFVLYVISHLENLRNSENPDHAAIKNTIHSNKQHHMQISLLNKKFRHQLQKFGRSSRNYQLDQTFDKMESGLIIEGDIVYEEEQQQQVSFLPKLVRVNVSLPLMGQTMNVVEVSIRQDNMESEFVKALRPLQDAKFTAESIEKVVSEFKQQITEQQQRQQQSGQQMSKTPLADISIKVQGSTVVYMCSDDMKTQESLSRQTRSIRSTSALEDILSQLKRNQLSFNRGFHFDINKRIANIFDVEAHLIGGLLLDSRVVAQRGTQDFEVQIQLEPRVSFEAIVGPAASNKRLLHRASTKSAFGMRLRYKQNEVVDVQIDLPSDEMELFKIETQMVEKDMQSQNAYNEYSYLADSIYGEENIYAPEQHDFEGEDISETEWEKEALKKSAYPKKAFVSGMKPRKMKLSSFQNKKQTSSWGLPLVAGNKQYSRKSAFVVERETPEIVARALGLRSKFNFVVSPKDSTFLTSWIIKKYEPTMQGFRVQVQQQQQGSHQNQYIVALSTPGSRVERNMELRVMKQSATDRTILKVDVNSQLMSGSSQIELIHDGRQWAIKAETGASRGQQLRSASVYKFEAGVQRSTQSGKIATTFKPFLLVQAPELARPIEIQGLISYQQSPKTVITYELKTQDSAKYIQGKYILQKRSTSSPLTKRTAQRTQRSMQSPLERMFQWNQEDITMTNEIVAQWRDLALKQNIMIESEGNTFGFDMTNQYKTKHSHKTEENRLIARVNYTQDRRSVHFEHRCSTFPVHNFRYDSQYETSKKLFSAKFVSKSTTVQYVADLGDAKKAELIVEREGRRVFAIQNRFDLQGEEYHFNAVAQYKSQPLAKISGKVPAMLLEEPTQFVRHMQRFHKTVVEFDGIVYQPTQAQVAGKFDLQKKELYTVYKTERAQEHKELKARFDDNLATFFVEAFLKSTEGDLKASAKINMPGLVETFFGQTKSSSWKRSSFWTVPSWMKGQVDSSELIYNSRQTQLTAKLIPREELVVVIKGQRLQHQSRVNLSSAQKLYKLKSSTTYDRRNCDLEVELNGQQKVAIVKVGTKQSNALLIANWPEKKIDMSLDVDGVRLISHQSSLSHDNKFYKFLSNLEYGQKPAFLVQGKVPSELIASPMSIFGGIRYGASELSVRGSDQTQMKLRIVPGNELEAIFMSPAQEHKVHLVMQNGLDLSVVSVSQNGLKYNVELDVNQQQKKAVVKFTTKRVAAQCVVDLEQNKFDLVADLNGRRVVATESRIERVGDLYHVTIVAQYKGLPLAKIFGKVPAILLDEPAEFYRDMHRFNKAVVEFNGAVFQPIRAEVQAKADLQKKELYAIYKADREQEHKELKARFDDNVATLFVEAFLKSIHGDAKASAKINMPGLVETFLSQTKSSSWKRSSFAVPSWMKGQVDSSELIYNSRQTQLKAKLIPREELAIVIDGQKLQHQSRVSFKPDQRVFKLKANTVYEGRRCDAEIEIDAQEKMAVVKANYRQTALQFVCDLPNQKLNLFVDVDGTRVVAHQARLVREGKFFTINSQIEYNQQPFAHVEGKIPAIFFEEPSSIWERRISEQTELSYEARDTQMKIKYIPGVEFVAVAKTPAGEHRSRAVAMPRGNWMLSADRMTPNGVNYDILDDLKPKSWVEAIDAITNPLKWIAVRGGLCGILRVC